MGIIPDYASRNTERIPPLNQGWLKVARCFALTLTLAAIPVAVWLVRTGELPMVSLNSSVFIAGMALSVIGGCALVCHVAVNWHRLRNGINKSREWKSILFTSLWLLIIALSAFVMFGVQSFPSARNTF